MADQKLRIVLSAVDQASGVLGKVGTSLGGIGAAASRVTAALGPLGTALAATLSVGSITAFVKSVVDGIDALNDFADATGTTVENASALEAAAKRTGNSMDDVAAAANRLTQILAGKGGDNASDELERLGLSFERLRQMDPAEALLEVARAYARFADDAGKAQSQALLFGRAASSIAPFLKDLAEQGALVATTTAEQAAEAEKFNKQLAEFKTNIEGIARDIVGALLPSLNDFLRKMREIDSLPERVWYVLSGQATRDFVRGGPAQTGNGASGSWDDPRDTLRRMEASYRPPLGSPRVSAGSSSTAKARVDSARELEQYMRRIADLQEKDLLAQEEAYELAMRREAIYKRTMDIAAQEEFDRVIAEMQPYANNLERFIELQEELQRAQQKNTDLSKQLGMTFSSAFEDAVVSGRKLRDVLSGILQDIARILARRVFTQSILPGLEALLPGLLPSAKGNAFGPAGVIPFASGGVVNRPTIFPFAAGIGLMGEAGPEAILPLKRGRDGRLGVTGSGVTVNVINNTSAQATVQERTGAGGARIIDVMIDQLQARIASDIARGSGPVPAAIAGTFGLNRVAGAY